MEVLRDSGWEKEVRVENGFGWVLACCSPRLKCPAFDIELRSDLKKALWIILKRPLGACFHTDTR